MACQEPRKSSTVLKAASSTRPVIVCRERDVENKLKISRKARNGIPVEHAKNLYCEIFFGYSENKAVLSGPDASSLRSVTYALPYSKAAMYRPKSTPQKIAWKGKKRPATRTVRCNSTETYSSKELQISCFLCNNVSAGDNDFLDHFLDAHYENGVIHDRVKDDGAVGGGRKRQTADDKINRIASILVDYLHEYPGDNINIRISTAVAITLRRKINSLRRQNCQKVLSIMWRNNRQGLRDRVRDLFNIKMENQTTCSTSSEITADTECFSCPANETKSGTKSESVVISHFEDVLTEPGTLNKEASNLHEKDLKKEYECCPDQIKESVRTYGTRSPCQSETHSVVREQTTESNSILSPFSKSPDNVQENHPVSKNPKLYCVCQESFNYSRSMIECDECEEWYHYACINLEPKCRRKSYLDKVTFICGLNGCNNGEGVFVHNSSKSKSAMPSGKASDKDARPPREEMDAQSKVLSWIQGSDKTVSPGNTSFLVHTPPNLSPISVSSTAYPNCTKHSTDLSNTKIKAQLKEDNTSTTSSSCLLDIPISSCVHENLSEPAQLNDNMLGELTDKTSPKAINSDEDTDDILPSSVRNDMCTEHSLKVAQDKTYWTVQLPAKNRCFFFIDKSDWMSLKKQQNGNSFPKCWIHVFIKGLKKLHPYCSFQFRRHYVSCKSRGQSRTAFRASGYCNFSDCTVKFKLIVKNERELKAQVSFTGKVKHKRGERRARFVRNTQREALRNLLKYKKPRREHLDNLKGINDEVFMSGCRDEAPKKEVLHTISCEARKLSAESEITTLLNIIRQQSDLSKRIPGILRQVCLSPAYVMLYSQDAIKVYHHISSRDVIYLDATGSVICNNSQFSGSKKYQLYDLVVRHPIKGSPPFVLASLLTVEHNAVLISYFLQCFLHSEQSLYGHHGVSSPLMIMIDGSPTLLLAVLRAFNCESVQEYFSRCYRIVTGAAKEEDFKKTLIHICASHVMKNAAKLCRKYYQGNFRDAMYWIGLLLQSTSLEDIDDTVQSLTVITHSRFTTSNVKAHYHNLKCKVEQTDTENLECVLGQHEDDTDEAGWQENQVVNDSDLRHSNISEDEYVKKVPNSPFRSHFKRVAEYTIDLVVKDNVLSKESSRVKRNPYYGKEFMNYLLDFLLPNIPNWSGLLLQDLGRHGTSSMYTAYSKKYNNLQKSKFQNISADNRTQGAIEKSMQEVKRAKLNSSRCRKVSDFVLVYERDMLPLQREFCEAFCTSKRRVHPKSLKLSTEKWSKRVRSSTPSKKGIYLMPPSKSLQFKETGKKNRQRNRKNNSSEAEFAESTRISTVRTKTGKTEASKTIGDNASTHRGIANNSVSCWWIATIQAVKPFIGVANPAVEKFQGSEFSIWRNLIKLFHTLSADIQHPISFHSVQTLIKESATQINFRCNEQQDATEFYTQIIVPFLRETCLTNEVELSKSVMCVECTECVEVETNTSCVLPVPVQENSLVKCLYTFLQDEIVTGVDCDLCKQKEVKKMIVSRIVNCPSLLVIQLLRFRVVDGRQEKITAHVAPSMTLDLSQFCLNKTPAVFELRSVIVHDGLSLESGHYRTFVRNADGATFLEFNDHEVNEVTALCFAEDVSEAGYLFFYLKSSVPDSEIPDESWFFVNDTDEAFVSLVWQSLDNKNMHSVSLRDERTKHFLSFHDFATIDANPKPPVLKRLKHIYTNYQTGWLSEVVVDFYISQLAKENLQRLVGTLDCIETRQILNKQYTPQTFRIVAKKVSDGGNFFDVMIFPFLQNRHFELYVFDNDRKQISCFDSLSNKRDNRQKLVKHGNLFYEFFQNGTTNRYWSRMPAVFEKWTKPSIVQARCAQQEDSASCGIFCCLFAEQVCFPDKQIKPGDSIDKLRLYVAAQLVKRSVIVDPELLRLYSAYKQ